MTTTLRSARLRGIHTLADQVEDWRREVASPKRRIPLGWPDLDELVRGPARGEVFTIVGRAFTGKSLIATNIMANNPEMRAMFFSLEMPAHQVLHRLAAHVFNFPARDLEEREMAQALPDFVAELPERLPYQVVVDDSALSLDDMSAYMADYTTFHGQRPQLIIIDYLEEIGGGKASGEGWIKTEATASAVKSFAKDEKVGVVMLHQANRNVRPYMPPNEDSAKGAGMVESDVVIGLWRPGWDDTLPPSVREERQHWLAMNVLKNRVRGIKHDGFLYRLDPAMKIVRHEPDAARVSAYELAMMFGD